LDDVLLLHTLFNNKNLMVLEYMANPNIIYSRSRPGQFNKSALLLK
jgi:hypothetical protein